MLLQLAALSLMLMSSLALAPNKRAGDVVIENNSDSFELIDVNYEDNQSFVYTSVVNFEQGQAAGLVFGASEDEHYWVFNVDRYENSTKLIYFSKVDNEMSAIELRKDYIIGNDKVTQSELNLINPKIRENARFHLKLVVTVEDDKVYAEFFLDDIKRFGVDSVIDLNDLKENLSYKGGSLGYNVFNSKVRFTDTTNGKSDYSYYTELYRNQYHYSQFSHWNNDPNGLVYYNGWYHMFYQTHPYSKTWSDMYWGHARSRDLVHWENLPIALFPDDGNMGVGLGNGLAWSGIAMVYHQGMSDLIDNENWFPSGEGLLGYYTRDGMRQDQVIITSDDEGITWTKRALISQHLIINDRKVDCRDPSIFPLTMSGDKVTLWGMVLSGGTQDKIWYLMSSDLVNWEYAGGFDYVYPECVVVAKVRTENNEEHYVMSVSSRYYAIGDFSYNPYSREISFSTVNGGLASQADFKKMDYGEDSYAGQAFYIDDDASEYYGKTVFVSWYSGLPSDAESGIYETVRDPWNGGGMTIPVELGIDKINEDYVLTQKPITIDNDGFTKNNIIDVKNTSFAGENNILSDVNTHIFELVADIDNPNEEDIEFRVSVSEDEYTSFGWNKTRGYYVDRAHTSDAGIHFAKNYHGLFTTGPTNDKHQAFYVLSDNGGLEVFAGEYRYNFYNLTLAAPYSIGAELHVSGEVEINKLEVNSIASIWHDPSELDRGILLLDKNHIDLDLNLGDEKEIIAYSSNDEEVSWSIEEGEGIVSLSETTKGVKVKALQNGEAVVKASTISDEKTVSITVDNADVNCFFSPTKENIYSGEWLTSSKGLVGKQNGGDGFIISDRSVEDATYAATFDLSNAAAAGLLVRATRDMSSYIMANYDKNGNVCKIWTNEREIARANVSVGDLSDITLSVRLIGNRIELSINGSTVINTLLNDNDPKEGLLGLNVCAGTVIFHQVSLLREEYDFENKDLIIFSGVEQHIKAIYNVNQKNTLIDSRYYSSKGNEITISKEYFYLLDENTTYSFYIEGELSNFQVKIKVKDINYEYDFFDMEIQENTDLSIFVGKLNIESLKVNDVEVEYEIKDYVLKINSKDLVIGDNEININDEYIFTVTVLEMGDTHGEVKPNKSVGCGGSISMTSTILSFLSLGGLSLLLLKKRGKEDE